MRSAQASLAQAGTSDGVASSTDPPPTNGSINRPVRGGARAAIRGSSEDLPPGHFRNGVSVGDASILGVVSPWKESCAVTDACRATVLPGTVSSLLGLVLGWPRRPQSRRPI